MLEYQHFYTCWYSNTALAMIKCLMMIVNVIAKARQVKVVYNLKNFTDSIANKEK